MRVLKVLFMTAAVMGISACGGGGYSVSGVAKPAAAPALTTGNWWLQAIPNSRGGLTRDYSGPLTMSGNTVSMSSAADVCLKSDFTTPLVLSGQVTGSSISLTSPPSPTGFVFTVTGTTGNGSNIDGTYQFAGGTDSTSCIASVGTVYGTLVPVLNGNWGGTVTEDQYGVNNPGPTPPPGYVPNTASVALSLTQATVAQNFGSAGAGIGVFSAFPLSGSVTWTNSQCYGSGTIDPTQSYIRGATVEIVVNAKGGGYPTYSFGSPLPDPSRALTAFPISLSPIDGVCGFYTVSGTLPSS